MKERTRAELFKATRPSKLVVKRRTPPTTKLRTRA